MTRAASCKEGRRRYKPLAILSVAVLIGGGLVADVGCARAAFLEVGARLEEDRLVILVAGEVFTCYKFSHAQKYPYFWPVNGPISRQSVTTESSEPYPHHHSLFFGCDRVNGANFWQDTNERGQILSEGPRIVEATGQRVVFTDRCLWRQPGHQPVMADERRVVVTARPYVNLIDFEITLTPLVEVTIEKTNHSLFSARMIEEMSVKGGGTLRNAEGGSAEKGTWGIASPWCDYSAKRQLPASAGGATASDTTVTEGLAIFQHPGNRWYPSPWFTRDYGFFSPTPMNWLPGDRLVLPKGEAMTLRYRVVVHTGDAEEAKVARLFDEYAGLSGAADETPGGDGG